jgi:twitching motility protein PilT
VRLHGALAEVRYRELDAEELGELLREILSESQWSAYQAGGDLDLSYAPEGLGRFRAHFFRKMEGLAAAFRIIPEEIPTLEALGLPPIVRQLIQMHQGCVLVTGATGTGKSTTLAAMIDHLNQTRPLNIVTLEDPIEFVHSSKRALVVQREVGTHVASFAEGLRAVLREDPDVILVGELRNPETIAMALMAAETGHLVLGTLHTTSATKTLERIIDAAPADQKEDVAVVLSQVLHGVVSQALVRTADGQARRAVTEILVMTPAIAHLLASGRIFQIPMKIATGRSHGMHLMDQALLDALQKKEIDADEAYLLADDKKQFQRFVTDPGLLPRISLVSG